VIATPALTVPHPACWRRRFVLDPWCDVTPDWRHPFLKETVKGMRDRLLVRPLQVGLIGEDRNWVDRVREALEGAFSGLEVDVQLLDSPAERAAINFLPFGGTAARRSVGLGPESEVESLSRETLRAMLDEPIPIPAIIDPHNSPLS
jgi:2-amino-4-hydroxy-6-hydroxymethyldihydropteridine diphosphokinase